MKMKLSVDEYGVAKVYDRITHPVKRLLEFNPINRPEAFFDPLLNKAQPSEHTISDSESTEHLLFVVFTKFSIW